MSKTASLPTVAKWHMYSQHIILEAITAKKFGGLPYKPLMRSTYANVVTVGFKCGTEVHDSISQRHIYSGRLIGYHMSSSVK